MGWEFRIQTNKQVLDLDEGENKEKCLLEGL